MARLSPSAHIPSLSFRMELQVGVFPQAHIYCKSFQLPTIDNSTVIAEYGNTQMKLKGKTKWNSLNITCYQYENITINEVWEYFTKHQKVETGEDQYADNYKNDITLKVLKASGIESSHEFKLHGAFIATVDFGQFDWASEEIVEIPITIDYDYALKTK